MWRVALLVVLASAAPACSDPPFIDPPNPFLGQITQVLEEKFWVTASTGDRFEFVNANPEDEGMGQAHMRVHMADRTPVLVTWRRDGYNLVAVKIADGGQASPTGFPALSPSPA